MNNAHDMIWDNESSFTITSVKYEKEKPVLVRPAT